MANRVAVLVMGGLVVVGLVVVGGVVALVLGGMSAGGAGTPTADAHTPLSPDDGGSAAGTATGTAHGTVAPTPTPAPTATPTPTPTARPTVAPAAFDAERIEVLVFELVNERRAEEGLDPLEMNRSLASEVREMARNHSETMAEADAPRHTINGVSSTDRYEENELYYTCRWETDNEGLMRADVNSFESNQSAFEAVTRTVAGREYEVDGETRFNADERDVAEAIVEEWWNDLRHDKRLLLPNARMVGVGVEVTEDGDVFATANLC